MRFIDRFTLDDVSAKVWWPLTLVALVGLVLTFPAGNRAADETRAAAAARATELSTASVELSPTLPPTTLPALVGRSDAATTTAVLSMYEQDPIWSVVRVWSPQFTLWASSDPGEQSQISSGEADNDDDLRTTKAEGTFSVVTNRLPTGGPGPTTFHAYTKIPGLAGAGAYYTEFEARDSVLLADVHREWLGYRIVGVVATLVLLGFAIASMREPRAKIGTNVPFYPESVPTGQAIIDSNRAVELDQADERIQDRISGLQERLDESERLRLKAEAQLQQALTALGSPGRGVPASRPAVAEPKEAQPPAAAPRRAPQPAPAQKPAPQPVPTANATPAAQQKPAVQPKPVAQPQSVAQPKPVPQPVAQPKPVVQPAARAKPAAARATPTAQPAQQPAAKQAPVKQPAATQPAAKQPAAKAPPPPVTAPQPAAKAPPRPPKRRVGKHAPPEPITVASDQVAATSTTGGKDPAARPEVVVLPDAEKPRVAARARGGKDSDADVLDVLNRLVPGADEPHPTDEPGDLRARLARTAALKKPGSRERQEQREAANEGPSQQ